MQLIATFKESELKNYLIQLLPTISNDDTRYYLNGVCFDIAKTSSDTTTLIMVATDEHKLCKIEPSTVFLDTTKEQQILIHKKDIEKLVKSLNKKSEDLIYFKDNGDNTYNFETSTWQHRVIGIEDRAFGGKFPDYNRVFPSCESEFEIGFNPKYLKEICEAIIKSGDNGSIKLALANGVPTVITLNKEELPKDSPTYLLMPMRL